MLSQISDHFPRFLIIKNVTVDYRNCSLFQDDYSKFNEHSFINDFKELLWEDINDLNLNLNGNFDNFYEKVHTTVIQHAPLKKVTQKQLKLKAKPWVNPHIQKLINYRYKLLRKLRKSHSKSTEELYKKFRNRVVRENRTSKKKYFETYFQTNKSNMKVFGQELILSLTLNPENQYKISLNLQSMVNLIQILRKWQAHLIISLLMSLTRYALKYLGRKTSPLDYLMKRNSSFFFTKPITLKLKRLYLLSEIVNPLDPTVYL